MPGMRLDVTKVGLPRGNRDMFQGDQDDTIDVNVTRGMLIPLRAPMIAAHVLPGITVFEPRINCKHYGAHLQETVDFLSDFRRQLGLGDGGRFTPPILRSHLGRWSNGV
jgi:hypothetical protein